MQYRKLGRTGLEVSVVSLGMEHLHAQPREIVGTVVGEALARGVNYLDLVYNFPETLDTLGAALQGRRDQVILACHLGSTVKDGQYCRSDNAKKCEATFLDSLSRLGTDHADVLVLHNFSTAREWETAARPGGRFDLACRLRDEGKARFLGISGHFLEPLAGAISTGQVDLAMFPLNLLGHAMPGRNEVQKLCVAHNLAIVAMKPYGGGRLLAEKGLIRVPKYQTGGESFKARLPDDITPSQCLGYVLAQVGVSTALVGAKSMEQMDAALHFLEASEEERDFSQLLASFGRYEEGECVYCNHCLPCPAAIDIAEVIRLLDAARQSTSADLRQAYAALPAGASDCIECGECEGRCPFGVHVIESMKETVALFEAE